jgi:hypothetical protein
MVEKIQFANPLELTRQETPPDEPMHQEPLPEEPLKYGDLVVVDYAEKKKVYKWPAIVHFSLSTSNFRLCRLDI